MTAPGSRAAVAAPPPPPSRQSARKSGGFRAATLLVLFLLALLAGLAPGAAQAQVPGAPDAPVIVNSWGTGFTFTWGLPSNTGGSTLNGTTAQVFNSVGTSVQTFTVPLSATSTLTTFSGTYTHSSNADGTYTVKAWATNADGTGAESTATTVDTSSPPSRSVTWSTGSFTETSDNDGRVSGSITATPDGRPL